MQPTTPPQKIKTDLYPKDIYAKLEFDKLLELLSDRCISSLGKAYVKRIKIVANPQLIEQLLLQVHECKQLLMVEDQPLPTHNYLDLQEEITLLGIENAVLNEQQLFRLYKVLLVTMELLQYLGDNADRRERYPTLSALLEGVGISKNLINQIKAIITDDGKIRSDASKELLHIRKQMQIRYQDLDRRFNAVLVEYKNNGWLADSLESVRDGRRVLAVIAEHKRKIRGIIHDESRTGSISYIEPDATLQISNEIVEWQQAEKREIYRILQELTAKIQPFTADIKTYQRLLGLFDFIRAKAVLAQDLNAHMPRLTTDKSVEIFSGYHPLLYLKNKAQGKTTVPLNLRLSIAERILVISGPNAGGKSVLLKAIGLLQLMLQSGMLIPAADHSIMSVFRNIFIDIGDEQSIENDLSTYSSHLNNMRYFTDFADNKTLILIDEFGAGTDPALGGPIAEAILEYLNKKFCYGVITTHYSNLKVYATKTNGIINGAMLFDYKNLSPLYKLEVGRPGSSFAFELAAKSRLRKEIVDEAKGKVDAEYRDFDELLSNLQREKQLAAEREKVAAQKEKEYQTLLADYTVKKQELEKKQKTILLETEQKALDSLNEKNRKFEQLVKELKENKGERETIQKIKTEVEKDRQQLSQSIEILKDNLYYRDSKAPISVGASVRLLSGKEIGEVLELRKGQAIVQFEMLKTNVKTKELVVVEPVKPKDRSGVTIYNTIEARSEFDTTLDVRGMRREEALQAVEDIIDRALMYNAPEIKIIHGIGDGILRRSIREMLRNFRAVTAVRDEDQQYGGAGVSLISLS